MAADTVKSASITTLDAASPSLNASLIEGAGAAGRLVDHSDFVAVTTGGLASTSSTYKMLRLPTSCTLKLARLFNKSGLDTGTALTIDLGAYYSDSTVDGTAYANQGVLINASCFVSNKAFAQSSAGSEIDALSNLDANLRNSQLWQQVGLASDPGGYIDIVLAVHTAATVGVAGNVVLTAEVVN